MPELTNAWDGEGPSLLQTATKIIGKPFIYSEKDIPVFLCSAIPGWGLPLMVPVTPYLKTANGSDTWDNFEFIDAVFHELLHMYVVRALRWNPRTDLLKKFGNEAIYTKIHLHLYALQKAVYLASNKGDWWARTLKRTRGFGAEYQRAVDIVEQEGFEPFIKELKGEQSSGSISARPSLASGSWVLALRKPLIDHRIEF